MALLGHKHCTTVSSNENSPTIENENENENDIEKGRELFPREIGKEKNAVVGKLHILHNIRIKHNLLTMCKFSEIKKKNANEHRFGRMRQWQPNKIKSILGSTFSTRKGTRNSNANRECL